MGKYNNNKKKIDLDIHTYFKKSQLFDLWSKVKVTVTSFLGNIPLCLNIKYESSKITN